MNKQEQIEKMATALACGNCGQLSWDCPEDTGAECGLKYVMKPIASKLVQAGYINGADFVEWLKENAVSMTAHGAEYIAVGRLAEALQEYLKGE